MENQESTSFGVRLKAARKRAKLTQAAAAKRVGMAQGTLAELEKDGQGSSYAPALAALYEVDSYWLATGKGDMKRSEGYPRLVAKSGGDAEEDRDLDVVTAEEVIELSSAYAKLSKEERSIILKSAKAAAERADGKGRKEL
jgi:transcriptional regulator with XRE-family HTH domain